MADPYPTPLTVAELIALLQAFDPAMPVMVRCDDDYYSGPVTAEGISIGRAFLVGPGEYVQTEDAYGKPMHKVRKTTGGWVVRDVGRGPQGNWDVLQDRSCVMIIAEG